MNASEGPTADVLVCARILPGAEAAFADWQTRLVAAVNASGGCASCELCPPMPPDQPDSVTIVRFATLEDMRRWRDSPQHRELLAAAAPLLEGGKPTEVAGAAAAVYQSTGSVTEVIVTDVTPGKEAAYRGWIDRVQRVQATFPGYGGLYVAPPKAGASNWTALLRFERLPLLRAWLDSPERQALLAEAKPFIARTLLNRVDSTFPGWVPSDPATGKAPSQWKTAALVLLCIYPIVMLQLRYLNPLLQALPGPTVTFVDNVVGLVLVTWPLMPLAVRAFERWLYPERESRGRELAFTAGVTVLALLELLAFTFHS